MNIHVYQEAMLPWISMHLPHNAVLHEDVRRDSWIFMSTRKRCCRESQCIFHTLRSFMRMVVWIHEYSCLPGSGAARNLNASSTQCGPSWGWSSRFMNIHVYQEAMLPWISMYLPHHAVLHEDGHLDSWIFMSTRKRCCCESQCIFHTMKSFMRMVI